MNSSEIDILVVEASQGFGESLIDILRLEHPTKRFVTANDGEEALNFLFCRGLFAKRSFSHPPKLVLLDEKLSKVTGTEVLKQLKEDPRTLAIPVIILASSSEESDPVRSYDLGVNSFIRKPADLEQLRNMVKTVGLYWTVINQRPTVNGVGRSRGIS